MLFDEKDLSVFDNTDSRDYFMEISIDDIKSVMSVYSANAQCTNRGRHSTDIATINEYIAAHSAGDGGEVEQREG